MVVILADVEEWTFLKYFSLRTARRTLLHYSVANFFSTSINSPLVKTVSLGNSLPRSEQRHKINFCAGVYNQNSFMAYIINSGCDLSIIVKYTVPSL